MSRNVVIWILAVLVTLGTAFWQRISGPSYPVRYKTEFAGQELAGKLLRTNSINSELPVLIKIAEPNSSNPGITGSMVLRNYPSQDQWLSFPMVYNTQSGKLEAGFNRPNMAAKVEYYVELSAQSKVLRIPAQEAAVARFKGDVPPIILITHIFFMFFGMLWSTRAGFEALVAGPAMYKQSLTALLLLLVGGLILGPIMQKYAFDAYWTGFPLGYDLTDNKLAIAVLVWLIAVFASRGSNELKCKGRWFVVAAMLVVFAVFSIPHSIHGSTFDYETGEHIQVSSIF